jgi:predicted RNA-binding Zn ribbon-like protein
MRLFEPFDKQLKLDEAHLCLDFANTIEWHASGHPVEYLHTYADLIEWAQEVQLIDTDEAAGLLAAATREPQAAEEALREAVALREAIYQLFSAASDSREPEQADLDLFNGALARALSRAAIRPEADGFRWARNPESSPPDRILAPVVLSAAELLTSENLYRVGVCADEGGCGWLFYDTSRNRSRRWCSMGSCGNRAKAQRHYQRKKGT